MRSGEPNVPAHWAVATIADIAQYVQRGKSPRYGASSKVPVVNQKCVRWDGVDIEHVKFIDPASLSGYGEERFLRDGDILWNSTGTGTIGRAAIFRELPGFRHVVADSHVTVIRSAVVEPEYLHFWIKSPVVQRQLHSMHTGSTNQVELSRSEVLETPVPIPPTGERKRIVETLRNARHRMVRARTALDSLGPLVESLRQSILAAAFRGDLTADWREKNSDVEPASLLLDRIRNERRQKWEEAELAKMRAKSQTVADDRWKQKYVEAEPANAALLPDLPQGWLWSSFSELAWDAGYGTSEKCEYDAAGIGVLRIPNIAKGMIDLTDLKRASRAVGDSSMFISPGDLLIVRTNGSLDLLGRAAAVHREYAEPLSFASYLIRYRFSDAAIGNWASRVLASPHGRDHVVTRAATSAGQYNLSLSKLDDTLVPLPPREELTEILRRIDQALRTAEILTDVILRSMSELETLEAAVLAKAFRGELVPQDPNDEPASVLLQRIRLERGKRNDVEPGATAGKDSVLSRTEHISRGRRRRHATAPLSLDSLAVADWTSASVVASSFGISESSSVDDVDAFYLRLRELERDGAIELQRVGDEDQIRNRA